VLRKLGSQRIWVDEQRVALYVGGNTEFEITRKTTSLSYVGPVWATRWKDSTQIADRLWTNVY
jgi:hypothetical protein